MKEVFISYSSKNFKEASTVKEALEKNDISCWMAPDSIPAGSNYSKEIPSGIKNCKIFLLILSDEAQESIWVSREVEQALNDNKTIIPFQIEDFKLNDSFNFYLSQVQRVSAYLEMEKSLKELVMKIKANLNIESIDTELSEDNIKEKIENAIEIGEYDLAKEMLKKIFLKGTKDYEFYILNAKLNLQLDDNAAFFKDMEKLQKLEKNEIVTKEINKLMHYKGTGSPVGITALHVAAFHFNYDLVKYCVEHGADVNIRVCAKQVTPIEMMFLNKQYKNNKKRIKEIRNYLMEHGAKDKFRLGY